MTRKNTSNSKQSESTDKDINISDGEKDSSKSQTLKERGSFKSSDVNLHGNDENDDIDDQDDWSCNELFIISIKLYL